MACESRNSVRKRAARAASGRPATAPQVEPPPVPAEIAYRRTWIEMQKRHEEPVNAIGLRIDPRDQMELKRWRDAGIDLHLRK